MIAFGEATTSIVVGLNSKVALVGPTKVQTPHVTAITFTFPKRGTAPQVAHHSGMEPP